MIKNSRSSVALLFLIYLLSTMVSAANKSFLDSQLNQEGKKAYDTLILAEQFEDEIIGFAMRPSKLVEAYRELLRQSQADAAFKSLLKKATPAGQLYALCGIYYTDHAFFLTVIEEHKNRNELVKTLSGCLGGGMPFSEILEKKAPNVVRLSSPEQTIDQWRGTNQAVREKGYQLDIVGGGYPSLFSKKAQ